ncbi:MAG: transketolase family protein [Firmicutes bacterium]|jgi:transketolase|nr:transketolase family protein [Bacillota bacterium]
MVKQDGRKPISTRKAFGQAIMELGASVENLVVLDGDISRSTYTVEFSQSFPTRHFNVGIAEQNQMGVAAGLALAGYKPIVASYAVFASMRALEQVRTSMCYPRLNVTIAASHGGLTPGNDGVTHQAIEDLGIMRTLPNMTVIAPADGVSLKPLLQQAIAWDGPVYMRLTRDAVPIIYDETDEFHIGKAKQLREGSDVTLIAIGDMVQWALKAHDLLLEEGITARILDMHTLKPLDSEAVIKAARETGAIVTIEDHNIHGGLGGAVAEVLTLDYPVPQGRIALRDTFAESGPYEKLLEKYGLSTDHIVQAVHDVIRKRDRK